MRTLSYEDLSMVDEHWRSAAKADLDSGREVPYGVIYLGKPCEVTEEDREWARRLIAERKIED